MWLQKQIIAEAGKSAIYQIWANIGPLLVPTMLSAFTVYQGHIEGLSLAMIITLTIIVLTASTFFVMMVMAYNTLVGISDKIQLRGPKYGTTNKGVPKEIVYILELRNFSFFPIEYVIKPTRCSLGNSINPDEQTKEISGIIEKEATNIRFSKIPITNEMKGKQVEGALELEIEYCKAGKKKKHKKIRKYKTSVKFKNNSKNIEIFDAANVFDKD